MTIGPDDKDNIEQDLDVDKDAFGVSELDDNPDGDDIEPSDAEEVPGLRGASELDSLHEEIQKYSSADLEAPPVKPLRKSSDDRSQRDPTAAEILKDELRTRALRDQGRIRAYLTGKIIIHLEDVKKRYLFDWTTEELRTGQTDETEGDCVIVLSEEDLMRIAFGDLNPQVGMLSDKIRVSGKLGLAIYIFNLIAPKHLLH